MKIRHEYNKSFHSIQFFNEDDELIYISMPFYNSLNDIIIPFYEESPEDDIVYNVINYILENKIAKYIKMETSIFKLNTKYLQHDFHFKILDNNILLELL